jgi:putative ABC transport system permease protein
VWGFALRAVAVRALSSRGEEERMSRFEDVASDVRWALRGLRKRPTFTVVAVATLALGIGANSAIFTLVSSHLFEPLPYERPDELVLIWETGRNNMEVNTVSPGNYLTWRDETASFEDVAAYNVDVATLSGDGPAERVNSSLVAPHFFNVLGVAPALGPGFDAASARMADAMQVVLSHSLWVRRFGGDPTVVGRDVRIDGRPHTVVGVMPRDYRQPERSLTWQTTELWRPMLLDDSREDRGSRYLRTIARRAPGVSVEQARQEMTLLGRRLAEEYPEANAGRAVLVRTLDEYLMGAVRPTLVMLLIAGAAVLLIVCANVANLTLARGEERRSEFALRSALGSGRRRLLRQIIVEGVVLALLGAAVGTVLVYAGASGLQSIQSRYFTGLVDVGVDWRVIVFTVAVAVWSGVLFGLPLARAASRPDLRAALVEGRARSGGGARSGATRNLLIVGQVGMATTLLVVAALLGRSFNRLINVPPGFEPDGVVAFSVTAPEPTYPDRASILRYHRDLSEAIAAVPGVEAVGIVSDLMFTTENMNADVVIEGRGVESGDAPTVEFHVVVPDYFGVLGIPLLAGELPDGWRVGAEVPVVVNRRMAEMHWPEGEAVGARFTMSWRPDVVHRVVAEVGDVLDDGYDGVADPTFYVPLAGMPRRRMSYVVRASGAPEDVVADVRAAVTLIDPDIPAGDLGLLSEMMAESVARPRAASLIGLTFALIALMVSTTGIYGVLSYAVQARTREIGIRSALGADGRELVSMVMRQATRLILVGLIIGTLGALAAGRAMAGLLFGVPSWDPASLFFAALVLGAAGLLASWVPARRAVAIDPTEALRSE